MTAPNIVKLKIHRNEAGVTIPYDTLYLFSRKHRELIPKIWQYALVLPLEEEFLKVIYRLTPTQTSHFKFNRDDEAEKVPVLKDLPSTRNSEYVVMKTAWWDDLFEKHSLKERVVVVPILTTKRQDKLFPKYLASSKWFERRAPQRNRYRSAEVVIPAPAINDLAYLATPLPEPNNVIRPICSICPRNMQHLQGECIPGMPICYQSLDLHNIIDKPKVSDASVQHD